MAAADRDGQNSRGGMTEVLGIPPLLLLCSLQLLGLVLLWLLEVPKAGPALLQFLHSSRTCSPPCTAPAALGHPWLGGD